MQTSPQTIHGLDAEGRFTEVNAAAGILAGPTAEVYALIFAPGFSTAETVTDLSGRGGRSDALARGRTGADALRAA